VKITKPKLEQMGHVCEYRSPAEVVKLKDEEYTQIYNSAVKTGLRKDWDDVGFCADEDTLNHPNMAGSRSGLKIRTASH